MGEIAISFGREAAGRARLSSPEMDAGEKSFFRIARKAKKLLNSR
jgi:hypothetical protein